MNKPTRYEIQVAQQIDSEWSAWFDGLTLSRGPHNTSVLCGPVPDQAALYGLLEKARDLGLTLLSVRRLDSPPGPAATERQRR